MKLTEAKLKSIIAENIKKVLKESDINNRDYDMSPEAVSQRNQYCPSQMEIGVVKKYARKDIRTVEEALSVIEEIIFNDNVNYGEGEKAKQYIKRALFQAKQGVENVRKYIDNSNPC